MSTNVGEATIALKFNTKTLDSSVKESSNIVSKSTDKMSKTSALAFGVVAGAAQAAFSKVSSIISSNMDAAIKRVDTLNNSQKVFKAMGYAAGDVSASMDTLNDYLDGLPTSLDSAVSSVQTLSASFGGIKNGTAVFKAMNDAGLAFGATSAQIEGAIAQLSQLDMDGPLDAQTWNSLRNNGFTPVFAAMAKESGKTMGQLKEDFGAKGTKSVRDFLEALKKMDKEGSGSMESLSSMARKNTEGIGTAITNVKNRISKGIGEILKAIGEEKIAGAINNISSRFSDIGKSIGNAIRSITSDTTFQKFMSDLAEAVQSAWSGIKTALSSMSVFVSQIFRDLAPMVGDVMKQIGSFINGVGSALQWVVQNQTAVAVLRAVAAAFVAMKGVAVILPQLVSFNAALQASGTLGNLAANGVKALADNIFSIKSVAALGATAVALLYETVSTWYQTQQMEAEHARAQYITTQQSIMSANSMLTQSYTTLKNAINGVSTARQNLNAAEGNLVAAQQQLATNQTNLANIARQYGMSVNEAKKYVDGLDLSSSNLTQKDLALAGAVTNLKTAQDNVKASTDKLKESEDLLAGAKEKVIDQGWKQVAAQQQVDIQNKLAVGDYAGVSSALQELATKTGKYTVKVEENGKMVEKTVNLNKADMKAMADYIGDQMARAKDENGRAWNKIWEDAESDIDKLTNKVKTSMSEEEGKSAGANYASGISVGISSKTKGLFDTVSHMAGGVVSKFKDILGIRSPSRVMRDQVGKMLVLGLSEGIDRESKTALEAAKSLSQDLTTAFGDTQGHLDAFATGMNMPEVELRSTAVGVFSSGNGGPGVIGGITVNMTNQINNEMDAEDIGRRLMTSIRRATL